MCDAPALRVRRKEYPPFGSLPQDIEWLDHTTDWGEAIESMAEQAKVIRYAGRLGEYTIRLGWNKNEWEVILTHRETFDAAGQPTRRHELRKKGKQRAT